MQRQDSCCLTDPRSEPQNSLREPPNEWAIRARWILIWATAGWLIPIAVALLF